MATKSDPVVAFKGVKPVGTYQRCGNQPAMPRNPSTFKTMVSGGKTPGGTRNNVNSLGIVTAKRP